MITTATVDDGDRREYILMDEELEIRQCFFKTIPLFALNEIPETSSCSYSCNSDAGRHVIYVKFLSYSFICGGHRMILKN
jgi:hypothetical protein